MTHDSVSFVTTSVDVTRAYSSTKYEFRVEKGWHWLQNLCFRVLRKIGARAIDLDYKVNRIDIQYKTLMTALASQHGEVLSRYALRGERLLIGADDFSTLVRDNTYIGQVLNFSIPDAVYKTEPSHSGLPREYTTTVMGLNVSIIPWMRGMLVVPELAPIQKVERRYESFQESWDDSEDWDMK